MGSAVISQRMTPDPFLRARDVWQRSFKTSAAPPGLVYRVAIKPHGSRHGLRSAAAPRLNRLVSFTHGLRHGLLFVAAPRLRTADCCVKRQTGAGGPGSVLTRSHRASGTSFGLA